jgi:hypothetical protein
MLVVVAPRKGFINTAGDAAGHQVSPRSPCAGREVTRPGRCSAFEARKSPALQNVDYESDGHRSVQVLLRYVPRDGSLFRENSAGRLGL